MSAADLLAAGGPLAAAIPGFTPRAEQQQMAEAVASALADGKPLIVEAGTGTGKTFAYLAPVLRSGQRVAISTGTKNLQDQLFHRDLPVVRAALHAGARVALLKGRGNYLCLYRMKRARGQPGLRFMDDRLSAIEAWARGTENGELSELGHFTEGDAVTRQVTSTADNCLGAKCPDFGPCFVAKARRNAQAAEVVVINHSLLLSDYVLRNQSDFGSLLSSLDAVIVDEAHQLPEAAMDFFGQRLSTRQLAGLVADSITAAEALGDIPLVIELAQLLANKNAALDSLFAQSAQRMKLPAFLALPGADAVVEAARAALTDLLEGLKPYEERSAELSSCVERAARLADAAQEIFESAAPRFVRWVESSGRMNSFHATPVEVAEDFAKMLATYPGAWVFTSATLAANDGFAHFAGQLGLQDARKLQLDSPFDYPTQARLYLPKGLPEPNQPSYTEAVVQAAVPVIQASGGGAFVLCTSHRALKTLAERLRALLPQTVYVQGELSRPALLEAFVKDGNGVLVGTSSFWEGVDVKGRALRVVIIDRIPFAAPGDPVYEARLDAIRTRGGSPFGEHQLPEAVVTLRQGVGRLIRDATDRGLLMLCDPRLTGKGYGKTLLASLPKMPVLRELAEAQAFARSL